MRWIYSISMVLGRGICMLFLTPPVLGMSAIIYSKVLIRLIIYENGQLILYEKQFQIMLIFQ